MPRGKSGGEVCPADRRVCRPCRCSISLKLEESADLVKWPKETKILISEYMYEDAYLKHTCTCYEDPREGQLVTQEDDFCEFFYQVKS